MQDDDDTYHVTDDDVERMTKALRVLRPDKEFTPDAVHTTLERLYTREKALEELSPELVEEILKDLEAY